MDRRRATLLLAVAIVLGVTLRLVGLQYGLPAVYNPDEVAIMNRAVAFATGDLNPRNFVYPTLYFYVLFAWEGLAFVAGRVAGVFDSTAAFERSFFVDPTYIYTAGRLFTTLCGVATIVATYALARRVAGRTAAVTAAALLAVAPLAVRDAHYVKHDVPVTLLIVLTHIGILRVNGAPRAWFVAGGLAGLAVSTHYYAVLLAAPFLAVLAVDARHGRTGNAVRGLAVAAIGGFVAVLVTSPFLFADPAATLADMSGKSSDRDGSSHRYARTLRQLDVLRELALQRCLRRGRVPAGGRRSSSRTCVRQPQRVDRAGVSRGVPVVHCQHVPGQPLLEPRPPVRGDSWRPCRLMAGRARRGAPSCRRDGRGPCHRGSEPGQCTDRQVLPASRHAHASVGLARTAGTCRHDDPG